MTNKNKSADKKTLGIKSFPFSPIAKNIINKPIDKKVIKNKQEKETDIQTMVNYYFKSKDLNLEEIKEDAKKRKIIYSRHVRPAKQLLELAGSLQKAKEAIDRVANWAKSHHLDYTIETVSKRWLELDTLKPKEIVKKPFYEDYPMVWSDAKQKWFVIIDGEWKEFAGDKKEIKWKIIK